jgi:hypothetical protein
VSQGDTRLADRDASSREILASLTRAAASHDETEAPLGERDASPSAATVPLDDTDASLSERD